MSSAEYAKKSAVLKELFDGIRVCTRCERCMTRQLAVPGEGDARAPIVLLGEAPGKKEDAFGRPFVGRTGVYVEKVLAEFGVTRDDFFITSILKCFHPGPPKQHQMASCRSWSESQIRAVGPRLILVMGRAAVSGFLGVEFPGTEELTSEWEGIRCVVTCHPAAAMRFPERNRQFRRDFKRALRLANSRPR